MVQLHMKSADRSVWICLRLLVHSDMQVMKRSSIALYVHIRKMQILAMKILFYARDIRGGLGERHVFRTILLWLAKNETESVKKNLKYVSEYGRFDDLLTLLDTPCEKEMLDLLKLQFTEDLHCASAGEHVSLLAKLASFCKYI